MDISGAGRQRVSSLFIVMIAIVLCLITFISCWYYIKKTFDQMEVVLDGALAMDSSIKNIAIKDTRISKLAHKAYKLAEMSTIHIAKTNQEKETIQSFISDMSHQMKTPLASISMYVEMLQSHSLSREEQEEFLLRIKYGVQKLEWLIPILFKLSRLETGIITLNPDDNKIKSTITESITNVYAMAAKKNIEIKAAEFDDFKLYYDKKWTVEALVNILENAIKYSEEYNTIEMYVEQQTMYSKIVIKNSGIGIKKEDYNNIFKRFYRGKDVKDMEGAGLGLYLTRLVLEKQGGYIMVDSKYGEYAEFSMFLQNCKK